ncbi:MAG TPA: phage integrase N-terminal SAM-like domain-containing protein [Candidatus Limnocylindrales bacterium]|nr:phage integrase N-terminal SAM-like domain-containing protein [Candidatus Limnocylindrales bacterium]
MGAKEVEEFITHLAREQTVVVSTQNQALNAIVFLYKEVLGIKFNQLHVEQAKKPEKLPGVFTCRESSVRQRGCKNFDGSGLKILLG